eukprot:GHVN01093473.1.p1 GENE.GHVN01093473.1~~GHVN01093473.1.p1  ORF type:complete len:321 (+),score=45.70 GHVN01093473.1:2-964(+)
MGFKMILSADLGMVKRGYDEICRLSSQENAVAWIEENRQEIEGVLKEKGLPAVKKKRFRFMSLLCRVSTDFLWEELVCEALENVKDQAEKTRKEAINATIEFANGYKKLDRFDDFLQIVKRCLLDPRLEFVAGAVISLSKAVFEFKDEFQNEERLLDICNWVYSKMTSNSRQVVGACLGFAKVLGEFLDGWMAQRVGRDVLKMTFALKASDRKHFRVGMGHVIERLVHVFGEETVLEWTGKEEKSLVLYVCRMARRDCDPFGNERKFGENWKSASKVRFVGRGKKKRISASKSEIKVLEKEIKKPKNAKKEEKEEKIHVF